MDKNTKDGYQIIANILIVFVGIVMITNYNPESANFPAIVYYLWLAIGIILGFFATHFTRKGQVINILPFVVTYIVITILSYQISSIINRVSTNRTVGYVIQYGSILVMVVSLYFLAIKIISLYKNTNKILPQINSTSKKDTIYLLSFSVLILLSIISVLASINNMKIIKLNDYMKQQNTMQKEIKKKNIDVNYSEGLSLIKKSDWYAAKSKFNDVIEIDLNYKDVQKNLEIVEKEIGRLDAIESAKKEAADKIQARKDKQKEIIKKWVQNEDFNFRQLKELYKKTGQISNNTTSSVTFDNITWLNNNTVKIRLQRKLQNWDAKMVENEFYIFTFNGEKYYVQEVNE